MFIFAHPRSERNLPSRGPASPERKKDPTVANCSPPAQSAMDLQQSIARFVSLRTGGRMRLPQVQILGSRVVLSGWTNSYHIIQLALAGLLDAFQERGLDRPEEIDLDIEVLPEAAVRRSDSEPIRPR